MRCGFAPCPANYMADNPRWNQPLSAWRELFTKWITSPGPEALLHAAILFDFRGLAGTLSLAEELRAHLTRTLRNQSVFFARLAGTVTLHRPPLGFFGAFSVDTKGKHKDKLDLKISALGPIVNIARLCALEAGIPETGTLDRLAALRPNHPLLSRYGRNSATPSNSSPCCASSTSSSRSRPAARATTSSTPQALSTYEKKSLKDAFRLISRVQDLIIEQYRTGLVGA